MELLGSTGSKFFSPDMLRKALESGALGSAAHPGTRDAPPKLCDTDAHLDQEERNMLQDYSDQLFGEAAQPLRLTSSRTKADSTIFRQLSRASVCVRAAPVPKPRCAGRVCTARVRADTAWRTWR